MQGRGEALLRGGGEGGRGRRWTELHKKKLDLLIETYPAAPAEGTGEDQGGETRRTEKLFREWAEEPVRAEKSDGVTILVSARTRGTSLSSRSTDAVTGPVPRGLRPEGRRRAAQGFKEKKSDEGLAEAVQLIARGVPGEKK